MGKKTVDITVGPSDKNHKKVALRGVHKVDNVPINPQDAAWKDKFVIHVNRGEFVVERTDYNGGWGQNLVLRCIVKDDGAEDAKQEKKSWAQLDGAATSIGIDDEGNMVCVNAAQECYERRKGERGWTKTDGVATQIARGGDGSTWCVTKDQQIFRREGGLGGPWKQMPGAAVFVAVGSKDQVVVVNAAQQIYKWNPDVSNWAHLEGHALTASIGADGTIFVCNRDQEIYRRVGAGWAKTAGSAVMPAVQHKDSVYVINSVHAIYCSKDSGATWSLCEGQLKHIAVSRGHIVGANNGHQLYHMAL
jgi:hypothetical protein